MAQVQHKPYPAQHKEFKSLSVFEHSFDEILVAGERANKKKLNIAARNHSILVVQFFNGNGQVFNTYPVQYY